MEYIVYENEVAYKTKYDGYYATRSGKIITVKVKGGQGSVDYSNPREHCYKVDKDGYLEVCLSMYDGIVHSRIYRRVHRVVWETFNGTIDNELTIDHIDHNKKNNNLSNLRLLTRAENTSEAHKGKKSAKRYMYNLFHNQQMIGVYDRNELYHMLGISRSIYYKNNKDIIEHNGYTICRVNVEDIERVL